MTDKEMILERGMVKLDIEESAESYLVFINDIRINKNKPLSTSKTVMSFNCPKKYILQAIGIPEGSVVLSRQEWEKYQISQRDYNATYFDGIYQARKETASAFVQEFENGIDELDTIINEENLENYVSVNEVLDFVDKIAKQFGVEVEE